MPRIPRFQSEMHFRCLSPIVMSTVREWGWQTEHALTACRTIQHSPNSFNQKLMRKYEAIHGSAPHDDTLTFRFDTDYISRRQGTRHASRRLQRHQDKRGNVSIPCLGEYFVDPNRLRMRFRRQKTAPVSVWQKSKYTTITFQIR